MLKPVLHRIILKLDEVEEVTKSGIIISKDLVKKERKAVETGVVVAIGETAFKDYGGPQIAQLRLGIRYLSRSTVVKK